VYQLSNIKSQIYSLINFSYKNRLSERKLPSIKRREKKRKKDEEETGYEFASRKREREREEWANNGRGKLTKKDSFYKVTQAAGGGGGEEGVGIKKDE